MRTTAWTALNVHSMYNNAASGKFYKTPSKKRNTYIKVTSNPTAKRRTSPHVLNYPPPMYGASIPLEPKPITTKRKTKRKLLTKLKRKHSDDFNKSATKNYLNLVEEKAQREIPPSKRKAKARTDINF